MKNLLIILFLSLTSKLAFSYNCVAEHRVDDGFKVDITIEDDLIGDSLITTQIADAVYTFQKVDEDLVELTIKSEINKNLDVKLTGNFNDQNRIKISQNTISTGYIFTCYKDEELTDLSERKHLSCKGEKSIRDTIAVAPLQVTADDPDKQNLDIDNAYFMNTLQSPSSYWNMIVLGPNYTNGVSAIAAPDKNGHLTLNFAQESSNYALKCEVAEEVTE